MSIILQRPSLAVLTMKLLTPFLLPLSILATSCFEADWIQRPERSISPNKGHVFKEIDDDIPVQEHQSTVKKSHQGSRHFKNTMCFAIIVVFLEVQCGIEHKVETAGGKIVGGYEAGQHQFPWMAALEVDGFIFCGGTLISNISEVIQYLLY